MFSLIRASPAFSLDSYVPEHPFADNSTYGNIDEIATDHIHMRLMPDFDTQMFIGQIFHDLTVLKETRVLQFDV